MVEKLAYLPAHNHLFVADVTRKTFGENLDFMRLW